MRISIALILLLFFTYACDSKKDKGVLPQTKNITESVYASVKVRPKIVYYPQPIRSGVIKKIYGKEGDLVGKGQILFEITPTEIIKGQLNTAEINLQEAKSNYLGSDNLLKNIALEIQITKEQLSLDSTNFKRQERLKEKNLENKSEYDQAKSKYYTTQNQLGILRKKYTQSQINLKNNYKKAVSQTKTEKGQLNDFTIRSEIDGKIYTINKEEGDLISSQEIFAEIGSAEDFILEMDIDEVDITKIEVGDSVLIILDAYADQVFVATVHKIFPKKDDITQTFRVEGTFNKNPPKLYNGLSGEANIIVSKRKNTLVIPTAYLLANNMVLTANGEVSIKVGMKNLDFVEVLSGIDSTTTIFKAEE
ncbi:efflux transporter periplasmic adaptor subunit [Putridiphycobacter roseus]|uniref:Efflux transporter periplasmic adaptor subunit n=1 Tax=Putridiphycobacter roseus TaxID=2219161 RepID=A0A2W1NVB0_9FLAO|nr:efflux RND transporter periplasmic adaptor subunit [Putridiphycobacter roseus]PZE18718.1 efflux transporter periplasmic adaptor subunit [Putridiphycobacter roseus]